MVRREICVRTLTLAPWGVRHERLVSPGPADLWSLLVTPKCPLGHQSCELVHNGVNCEHFHSISTFDESVHIASPDGESSSTLLEEIAKQKDVADNTKTPPRLERDFMFHWASTYVEFGLSVIPLVGKRPALKSWREFTERRATYDELRDWFGEGCDHNIGIIGGKVSQGLVIVDCDSTDDANWWLSKHPPSRMMVQTGRGGLHIYYSLPPECTMGNRTKVLGRAIDIKCEAGYVVAPPSVSPVTGKFYTWLESGIENFCPDNLVKFDSAWINVESPKQRSGTRVAFPPATTTVERSQRTENRIRGLVDYLNIEVADRSVRDFFVTCSLLRLGVTPCEICELVRDRSKFAGNPKYLSATIENALKSVRGP